jgi:hypothetical protein
MHTQETSSDSALRERLLKRIDADDFSQNFTITETAHGFSVCDISLNGPTLGPYPSPQKAQEELERQAALMKGLVRLYVLLNTED